MAIAYDSAGATFNAGSATPSTSLTPTGTLRGVFGIITQNSEPNDNSTGATYGGVPMTKIGSVVNPDPSEIGITIIWFLGSGIPAGNQDFIVTYPFSVSALAVLVGVTANADTELSGTGYATLTNGGSVSNPSVTITGNPGASWGVVAAHSGLNSPSGITANITTGGQMLNTYDFGNQSAFSAFSNPQTPSGNLTLGFNASAESVGLIGVAIKEKASVMSSLPLLGVG